MFVKTTLEGTEAVLSSQPNAIENFVVCDLPGFADFADCLPAEKRIIGKEGARWYGGMTYGQSLAAVRSGDLTGVAASDKLLGELQALVPVSKSWRTFNSVIGMCPNVPQYLAGNPYNMRLKRRCATATAPLSIFVELVASSGVDAKTCLKRGAAILALVRTLANLRPVELWCVIAIGQRNSRSSLCIRLDTAPLDLARSAHVFTHPSVFRALGYKSLDHEFYGGSWNGDWALGDHALHVRTAAESYQRLTTIRNCGRSRGLSRPRADRAKMTFLTLAVRPLTDIPSSKLLQRKIDHRALFRRSHFCFVHGFIALVLRASRPARGGLRVSQAQPRRQRNQLSRGLCAGSNVIGREASTDYAVSLSQLPATLQQRRLVLIVGTLLLVGLGIAAPFGNVQLEHYPAAIVAQQAVVFVNDFITSLLLFGQYSIVRSRGLLLLAGGYLFTALIVIPHALTFPNAFSPTGLLGAGLQSTAWLYVFWHIGTALGILAYACLKGTGRAESATLTPAAPTIAGCVAATISLVVGLTWLATAGDGFLPMVFANLVDMFPVTLEMAAGLVFLSGTVPFVVLLIRRHSVLDYWLMLVAWTLMLEEILIGFVTSARYSVGFYTGRALSLLTSIIILSLLLKEMIRLYARLARANIILARERENKLMSFEAITAAIAHQMNQPLAAIAANSGAALAYLQRTPPDFREIEEVLNDVIKDSHNASSAFDSIRSLFGRVDQPRRPVDMNEIVIDVLRSLRGELKEHGVVTHIELTSALPRIESDRNQLQQVILNLVHNAVEAMNATTTGSRMLRLTSRRHGNDAIAITVQDSGPGIDPPHLDKIFDAFVTTKVRGMGLGLAICRMIAERHGGRLTGSSDGKNGAVFELVLPI